MRYALLIALLIAAPLGAQTPAQPYDCATDAAAQKANDCTVDCSLATDEPFTILACHSGQGVDGYHVYVNDTLVGTYPTSEVHNDVLTIPFPNGIKNPWTYTFVIGAFNSHGEVKTEPLTVIVKSGATVKPTAVTWLRVSR